MDIAFVSAIALLWGGMVMLVWGFTKLGSPAGSRS